MKSSIFSLLTSLIFLSSCLSDAPTGNAFQDQLNKDKEAINTYLASKGITGVLSDPDGYGVKYKITLDGNGIKPIIDDSIKINYVTKLLPSETIVESSSSPPTYLLGTRIPGWQIGFPLVKEGSKATFYIPSGWAYGNVAYTTIPANSNLIFEIELLKVDAQLTRDTVAMDAYLASKPITAIKHPSGIRYVVTKTTTGTKPSLESNVTFSYVGKVLKGGKETTFQQSTFSGKVSGLIKGLQVGLPLIPVGSEATFYIPSPLGYSIFGTQDFSVAPKSNLIFEIKLTAIQ